MKKYIISPILNEVKVIIDKYYKYCKKQINENYLFFNLETLEKFVDSSVTCEKISIDIYNEVLHENILKYITPYFQLD